MKQPVSFFRCKIAVIMLLLTSTLYAQLPNFTLQATPTAQTCLGNGSINFTVTGNNPAASMAYEVFLLPNTTIPVAAVSELSAGNLVAGNYLIVATQTIGSQSNTATTTVTIADEVVPLAYTLVPVAGCGGNGSLIVNVTSGTAVSYEIMTGPVTFPQQASNTFTALPPGQYVVRVYDNCGDAVVVTVQIVPATTDIVVATGSVQGFPSCDMVTVKNDYIALNGSVVFWPVTFEYTVYPPDGGIPVIVTNTVTNGTGINGFYSATANLPFYSGEPYSYVLKLTDACGNIFTSEATAINIVGDWVLDFQWNPCFPEALSLFEFAYISLPVTITFLDAPEAFDPFEYNSQHPTFDTNILSYYKTGHLLPSGYYSVMLTDACGRSYTKSISVPPVNNEFHLEELPGECGFGGVRICMGGKGCVVREITAGPPEFSTSYPQDMINYVLFDNNDIGLSHLPEGDYTIHIIDECGNEYTIDYHITSNPLQKVVYQAPGCIENYGSISVEFEDNHLNSVVITAAPDAFTAPLPFDASASITEYGLFNMNSLPEGPYTIMTTSEECPDPVSTQISVTGYHTVYDEVTLIPNCGSFSLRLRQVANNNFVHTFWLQRYDEVSGTWGHPATAAPYIDGAVLTEFNSLPLTYTAINYNLAYTGQFRVIRAFDVFGNGTELSTCFTVIEEFTFEDGPQILNAYSFPCDDGTTEVIIVAEGMPPLSYSITEKNGQPFVVDNATSAFFTDLEPAIYNFMVTDVCGNIRNIIFDINTLEPMEIMPVGFCDGQDSSLTVPNFPFLVYEWYEQGNPGTIVSTTNKLDFPAFDPDTDTGTYIVHIEATTPGSCIDITVEHEIVPNGLPNAGDDNSISLCGGGEAIDLEDYLSSPHDAGGTWEDVTGTGALTDNMLDTSVLLQGTYLFIYTVTSACGIEDNATITLQVKEQPAAPVLSAVNPVCEGSDIQLSATAVPGAVYAWTGPGGFTSALQNPILVDTASNDTGTYSLTVTLNGCTSPPSTVAVVVNQAPEFTIDGNAVICGGQSSLLSVVPGNFSGGTVIYTWYLDGGVLSGVTEGTVEISEPGIYTIEVDNNGCISSEEIEVVINDNAFELELEAGCINDEYIITVVNRDDIPGTSFSWTGPQGFSSSEAQANITGSPGGEYHVTAVNADGCSAQATVSVNNTLCEIPRGISPNGDEWNNSFDLSNLDARKIMIFNRYGLQVYEKENYKDEWYGQSDKGELPTGTYYYVVTLSEGKEVTGWVYLQREVN